MMIVPTNKAIMDAPSSPPGIRFSKKTDNAAAAKQIATPSKNKPHSLIFDLIVSLLKALIFLFIVPQIGVECKGERN